MDNSKENKPKGRPKKSNNKEAYKNTPFYNNLNKLFGERNESQETVATALGTTRQSFGNWLSGRNQPDYEKLVAIADYYNVSTDYLLGRTDSKSVDDKFRAAAEITGLSDEAVNNLSLVKQENKATWHGEILNSILKNKYFFSIVIALTDLATTNNPNHIIDGSSYDITQKELLETILNKQFSLMIDSIVKEYKPRKEKDFRVYYQIASSLYQAGKLTHEQYQRVLDEYDKGNFEFVPDGYDKHGGAENG